MKKRLKNPKEIRSIAYKWAIYYLIILIVPVLVSTFAFERSQNVLREQNLNVNFKIVQQMTQRQEKNIMNVQRISQAVELSEVIRDFTFVPAENKVLQQSYIYEIRKELEAIAYMTENNLSFFLYLPDNDAYITAEGMYSSDVFFDSFLDKETPYELWKSNFTSSNAPYFFKTRFVFNELDIKDAIGFSTKVPAISMGDRKIMLGVMCNMSEFAKDIEENPLMSDGAVIILNQKDGQILFFDGEKDFEKALTQIKNDGTLAEELFVQNFGGVKTVVSRVTSEITGWDYVYFVPEKVFLSEVYSSYYRNLLFIVLIFVIGLVLMFFLIRKSYHPVKNILRLMGIETEIGVNEFELIADRIHQSIEERNSLSLALNKQNNIVRKNYLTRIMTGQANLKSDVGEVFENLEIPYLENDFFAVVMLSVESWEDFFADEKDLPDYDKSELTEFMFENVLSELFKEKGYTAFVFSFSGNIFCIIGGKDTELSLIRDILKYAQSFFKEKFEILFSAAVSEVSQGYEGIKKGYQQVSEIGELRFLLADQELVLYSDIEHSEDFRSLGINKQTVKAFIERNDSRGAVGYITEIIQQKLSYNKASVTMLRFYMFEITEVLMELINEIYQFDEVAKDMHNKLITALNADVSMDEHFDLFSEIIKKMCNDAGSVEKNNDVAMRIAEYIDKNYADINLNIATLSNALNLSGRYISAVFKKETGMGILDYIGKVRIDKVKTMLAETYMTIDDIFKKVGFTNKITFIRVFKKIEGITPSQYRTLSRNKNGM